MATFDEFEQRVRRYYTPRRLIALTGRIRTASLWLTNVFAPMMAPEATRVLQLDVSKDGKRRMATVQAEHLDPQAVEREGYETRDITPANIYEEMVSNVVDLMHRTFGRSEFNPLNFDRALQEKFKKDTRKLRVRLDRRIEYMTAQTLQYGRCPIVGRGVNRIEDYEMPAANRVTLMGSDVWTHADSDIEGFLTDLADQLDESGLTPDICVLGKNAARAMLNNESFMKDKMHPQNDRLGAIQPKFMGRKVRYLGTLKRADIQLYEYLEKYYDPDAGAEVPYIDPNKIVMGPSLKVRDLEEGMSTYFCAPVDPDAELPTKMHMEFSKETRPKRYIVDLKASPICVMNHSEAFAAPTVV